MKLWEKIEKKQFSPLYLLYGTESFLINETKQKLMTNVLTDEEMDFNLSIYDMEETTVEEALEDAETFPFFGDKKIVFLNNPIFLTSEKSKDKVEHNIKKLESYIESPAPYSILVLAGNYEKLDERKKITKLLKKNAEIIEAKKLSERELHNWISEQIEKKGQQINENAINLLLALVGPDLMNLHSELEKLSLYVKDSKVITDDIVEKLTSRSLEQNIFDLVDKVVQRKMDEVFRIYYDLRKQNEEPIKILALLASQFRLIYQVKELMKRGYGQQQIAGTLKTHPFRVKLASGQARSFNDKELGEIIHFLAQTDEQLKTGGSGREVSLELFLFKLGSLKIS
ncbi:DNA polymerase III subunit delta [Bacillus sp. FJAT-49711]|uniref:DNA polymerase III subunit delta n=1 Tax=Bacillus sp. FJAT-49711 TaxID=2833585 RepID=UPI001BC953BB|nr:DNA polymerase III subunit delta [Bacillus sp. FJAT-49711]MBS4217088.1 DNA polymerase III subunit delta [Bacillus sp. FJAT-49711]